MKAMSHMYRRAWHVGLKTTYYLRTLGASTIEKATVAAPAAVAEPSGSRRGARVLDRGDAQRRGMRGLSIRTRSRSAGNT